MIKYKSNSPKKKRSFYTPSSLSHAFQWWSYFDRIRTVSGPGYCTLISCCTCSPQNAHFDLFRLFKAIPQLNLPEGKGSCRPGNGLSNSTAIKGLVQYTTAVVPVEFYPHLIIKANYPEVGVFS